MPQPIDIIAADPCAAITAGTLTIHNCHQWGMTKAEFLLTKAACALGGGGGGGDMLAATYDSAGVAAQLAGASGQAINAAAFRTALGGTAVGVSLFTAANAAAARTAIGAGTGSGDALLAANQTFTGLNKFEGGLESYRTDLNQTRVGFGAAAFDADTGYTAVGTRALGNTLNSGGSVTAVGRDAGSFSTGGQSFFGGHAAGYKAYLSSYAVAAGYLSLANWADNPACDVEETVSLGHASLQYAVTGRYTVAVGAGAGGGITTVTTTRGVAIGFNAGNLPGDFSIARSVFIGNLAGATIAIGTKRLVVETDDVIAPIGTGALIYGEFDNRLIRFGATTVELGGGTTAAGLRFLEPSGSGAHYTSFIAGAQAANAVYILPIAEGTDTQALTWTTGGQLAWATIASGVALGDTPTWTGAHTWSKNSAVSVPTMTATGTWITGGSATTNKPHFLIEPAGTTSTGWQTTGTGLGINAAAAFAGSLLDMQVAGVSKLRVKSDGALQMAGGSGVEVWNTTATGVNGSRVLHFNNYLNFNDGNGAGMIAASALEIHIGPVLSLSNGVSSTRGDVVLLRDAAADILALRRTTNAQTLRVYGTADADGTFTNFVRASLGSSSTIVTLAAETAGTGADNVDIALTPAGTGLVKFGVFTADVGVILSGSIEIKSADGTTRKVGVVA